MRITKRKVLVILLIAAAIVYITNSSRLAPSRDGAPLLLAHRGLAQTFHMEGITNDTCTAERIYAPEHPYLENTIASMNAAFREGADIVEFDVQPTKDGRFVVFHDWTLDCRTNGAGVTRDHTAAELQALDIGYGYTADGGQTYPFRGKGIGLMPTLDEVLSTFPDRSFLIHVKSNDPDEGAQLAQYLKTLPTNRLEQLTVYGGDQPVAAVKELLPGLRTMSKASLIRSLLTYEALGWTGFIPSSIEHTQIHIPEKYAPYLWGWPNRFLERMEKADTRVIVVGGDGSEFSHGFDTPEDVERLPRGYTGGIWTNRIDLIAPMYRGK
ncbi:glycerophosphodiester phosphodiesterase family protein [Paenibacillus sp. OAS669]|uniref:glycerophosphodiester phosphodiesterase family protein n=1 Tax=Paenibacillus sp. OAS669 TaxID=2663821 RepID=UPI0017891ABE|nr:glycerophosphodiester phosphodiesterase family protein [Paenibacillus sp. OAS669]MBE1444048.1 glycerophosphoryl diester phosphodiesterase [Paenibacillus sp. OAS669]